jgi:hypothetical protein
MNRTVFNPQMNVDANIRTNMDNIQNSIEVIMNTIQYDINLSVRNSMNEILYNIDNIRNINWTNMEAMNNETYYRGQNALNSIQNSINSIMNNIRININTGIRNDMNNIQTYMNNIRNNITNARNNPVPVTLNNQIVNNNYSNFLSKSPYLTNLRQSAYYEGFIAGLIIGVVLTILFIMFASSLSSSQ